MQFDDRIFEEYLGLAEYSGRVEITSLPLTGKPAYDQRISIFNRANKSPVTISCLKDYISDLRNPRTAQISRAAFQKSFMILFDADQSSARRGTIKEAFRSIPIPVVDTRIQP